MKIIYDHQSFCLSKFNGVSNYFASIIPHIEKMGNECVFPFHYCDSVDLRNISGRKFLGTPQFIPYRIARKIQEQVCLFESINYMKHRHYDIIHATQYFPYLYGYTEKPVVVTVHDMIHELFNLWPAHALNKKESIEKCSHIIAISENTKKDILNLYPSVPESKITVIHHGYSQIPYVDYPNSFGKYILYVGARAKYKNFKVFFEGIKDLLKKDITLNLVCTGSAFNQEELRMIEENNLTGQCVSHFFKTEEMGALYKNALCFVYPSLYEGFGLPILDAFHFECPVCLSDASCFPEVAGSAGCYFDPSNAESIRDCINSVIYNEEKRREYIEKGLLRKQLFNWEDSAAKHCGVYSSLI